MRIVALTLAGALLFAARAAEACTCAVPNSATCAGTFDATAVLVATVVRIERETPQADQSLRPELRERPRNRVHLADVEMLKGRAVTSVVTDPFEESCGYNFTVGERYLIRGHARGEGPVGTGLCSMNRRLSDAEPLVRALRLILSAPGRGGRLVGQVWHATQWVNTVPDYGGLAGVRIRIRGPVTRDTITDRAGTFEVAELPAGVYTAQFRRPASATPLEDPEPEEFILPPGDDCVELHVRAEARGRIEGSVVDEHGEPIRGAFIQLGVARADGTIVRGGGLGLGTDALGRFVADQLPPGLYAVGPNAWGNSPSRMAPFLRTFATTSSGEPIIRLAPGAVVHLPPLRLVRLKEMMLNGVVSAPNGNSVQGLDVRFYIIEPGGQQFIDAAGYPDAAGHYTVRLWRGQRYRVTVGPVDALLSDIEFVAGEPTLNLPLTRVPRQ